MITTSSSSFESFISNRELYVDKTQYAYRMIMDDPGHGFYFISRPRRYGKSLMCSTLKCLFEGKRELFRGLYIDSADYSFEKFPVLSFNFALLDPYDYNIFSEMFCDMIRRQAEINGIGIALSSPAQMMSEIFDKADKRPVIIIDEFDAPIIHTIDDRNLCERIRQTFSAFYSVIKNRNEDVRFLFITGVTKLSNLSIFSAMNNLRDISMDPGYAGMYGYTEEELEANFSEYIDAYIERDDREYATRDEFLEAVRDYYDGYRFSPYSDVKVYNPVSAGSFFRDGCRFENYWQNTGVSTLAVNLAREYDMLAAVEDRSRILKEYISSFDITCIAEMTLSTEQVLALLYYSGYLTIADSDEESLYLKFPNREVRKTFTVNLVKRYIDRSEIGFYAADAVSVLRKGNIEGLIKEIKHFYNEVPYTLFDKNRERSYQLIFFTFFAAMGEHPIAEEVTSRGRSDVVFSYKNDVYIAELKVDGSSEDAISQIKSRGYADKYLRANKRVHLLGISFSSEKRQIEDWKEEQI